MMDAALLQTAAALGVCALLRIVPLRLQFARLSDLARSPGRGGDESLRRLLREAGWRAVGVFLHLAAGCVALVWIGHLAAQSQSPSWPLLLVFAGLAILAEEAGVLLRCPMIQQRRPRFGEWSAALQRAAARGVAALAAALIAEPAIAAYGAGWWLPLLPLGLVIGWAFGELEARLWRPRREPRRQLAEGPLRARLDALSRRCAIGIDAWLLISDPASPIANARAEAAGRRRQVTLWPSLLTRLDAAETDAVVAHELAHHALAHLPLRFLYQAAAWTSALALAALIAAPARASSTMLYAALVFVLVPQLRSVAEAALLAAYRRWELQADAFAVRRLGSSSALLSALERLLGAPPPAGAIHPWYRAFYHSHPPPEQRFDLLHTNASGIERQGRG